MFDSPLSPTPNVLMELSVTAYEYYKYNSIHLSGMNVQSNKISYANIHYHNEVKWFIPKCCKGNSEKWNEINLNQMCNNYLVITLDKSELRQFSMFNHVMITSHGLHSSADGSGKLLLLFARLQKKPTGIVWDKNHYIAVKECKKSVIGKHNKHHGSLGEYFSFGNKAAYETIDGSSVSQYAIKKCATVTQKCNIVVIEELIGRELKEGIDLLSSVQPSMSLKECVSPILDVAEHLQKYKGDVKLIPTSYSDYGIWKSVFCVNAVTEEVHCEDDCSDTVITVPRQQAIIRKRRYKFMFKLNDKETVAIPMNQELTFMFSGKFLLHKQSCNIHDSLRGDDYFFNFGTYANKKLFNHIRCSFARVAPQ